MLLPNGQESPRFSKANTPYIYRERAITPTVKLNGSIAKVVRAKLQSKAIGSAKPVTDSIKVNAADPVLG